MENVEVLDQRVFMRRGNHKKVIRTGQFDPGLRVYVQECRKCRMKHESTHVLFLCQDRETPCNGTMSIVQDFYDIESAT